jgi:hypothetical protein
MWPRQTLVAFALFVAANAAQADPAAQPSKVAATYKLVESWASIRVVVVDPSLRTEAGLLAIADVLRRDTASERIVGVLIYDDIRAAKLCRATQMGTIRKQDEKLHDDHDIGAYTRNANTGHHEIAMMLKGLNGPMKKVALH